MIDASTDTARKVRQRLQQQVDITNALSAWRFRLSLSVGIAEVPTVHQPSLEELLKLADALMYEHKRQERAGVRGETPHPAMA
jgi:GGDEF domain-containing protein